MDMTIHHGKSSLTPADEAQVRERVHFALERLSSRIRTLDVRFADLNGPRGGIDQQCTMEAILVRHGSLVVAVKHVDAVAAASEAANCLARRVTDTNERLRHLRRRPKAAQ